MTDKPFIVNPTKHKRAEPLPLVYRWLDKEPAPRMLIEALRLYGTKEFPGNQDNEEILSWAREVNLARVYSADAIPWCGLFMAIVAKRADKALPPDPLWAWNWKKFGSPRPDNFPRLGDVVTFGLIPGHGHVSLYVGEDEDAYHCLGGNQADAVNIRRFPKDKVHSVRRPDWKIAQPANVRRVFLKASGTLETRTL